jgi:hypothetical protein
MLLMAVEAFHTPKHRELQFEASKAPVVRGSGTVEYDLFRAEHSSGMLVVLWHGWLGHKTLRHVAHEVRNDGHNVVVIGKHTQAAHSMIKHAVQATGERDIIIWDHSDGHRGVSEMVKHQQDRGDEDLTYRIRSVLATAAIGTNGRKVNILGLPREIAGMAHLLRNHPREEIRVLGQSVQNYVHDPLHATLDGLRAATYKSSLTVGTHNGVVVEETYLIDDRVVEPPANRKNVIILPGSHLTPVVDPDVAREAISRAYAAAV